MTGRLLIGTSGFAYPEWKGDFYPPDIRPDGMLSFYAGWFPSVEINYTYQRLPTEKMLESWAGCTAEDFSFSFKAHRRITHERRLGDGCAGPLEEFLRSLSPLGRRLGPVLFGLPPNFKADLARLRDFLAMLPQGLRFAFEFRNDSWNSEETKRLLAERDAAWCVADNDECDAPLERTASGFVYVRLRKASYDDEALARWATAVGETLADGVDVYCYLKHEDQGRGVQLARALKELIPVGGAP